MVLSFIVLPATAFALLIRIGQVERFSFALGGYLGIATQIVSLNLKEARIWRLHLFDYETKNKALSGKWLNVLVLSISAIVFCYGVYYLFWGWNMM